MSDEELQERIEKGLVGDSTDEKAYRRVFDALKKAPDFKLSSEFANRVILKVQPMPQPRAAWEWIWISVGLLGFIFAAGLSIFLTDFSINFGALRFISTYPGLIVFGLLFVLALQWFDRKFVKGSMAH